MGDTIKNPICLTLHSVSELIEMRDGVEDAAVKGNLKAAAISMLEGALNALRGNSTLDYDE